MSEIDAEQEPPFPADPKWSIGRVAAIATVVLIAILWALAFAGWGRTADADLLSDREFVRTAIEACASHEEELDALPRANESKTPQERGEVVKESNAILDEMLDELDAIEVAKPADAKTISSWLADYRQHLADRVEYAEQLSGGNGLPFTESTRQNKALSKIVDKFVTTNSMESCATPDDV